MKEEVKFLQGNYKKLLEIFGVIENNNNKNDNKEKEN